MINSQKKTLMARYRDHRIAKKAKTEARWEPYAARRTVMENRASNFVSAMAGDYRFYTALCFVMAVVGFFWLQFMEMVALVGGIAMWQHWRRVLGTPEQLAISGFGFWRVLSFITIPVAAAGCAFMLFTIANGIMAGGWTGVMR